MPPSTSQSSNKKPFLASITCLIKSSGVLMGAGAIKVMKAAEVITQPVPASANRAGNMARGG